MLKNNTRIKKKIFIFVISSILMTIFLIGRLTYIMVFQSEYYTKLADELHERERSIKAARGEILDRNGEILAANKTDMWINQCINDTYEPGSTFKIITATAALEEKKVTLDSTFSCPEFKLVEDRRIRCHKTTGHGAETFVQATMNSCNPFFIELGLRVGTDNYFKYLEKLGILSKTGVDLPGEANTIMHKKEDVGEVELATMSFGQSFQITPLKLLRAASAVINGGTLVTPHFGIKTLDEEGNVVKEFTYGKYMASFIGYAP